MKIVKVDNLKGGEVLAKPILTKEYKILLSEELVLRPEYIDKIHNEYASTIQYHNENSLSSVLAIGYISAMKYYFKPVREMPTGRGFADFVFIPKQEYVMDYPALVVELKWNKDVKTAINQITVRINHLEAGMLIQK